jgi:hypothetical protein
MISAPRPMRPAVGVLVWLLVAGLPSSVVADDGRPQGQRAANRDTAGKVAAGSSPEAAALESLALSDRLAVYGRQQGDPVALVLAARIRKSLPASLADRGPRGATTLLAQAEAMAGGSTVIAALVKDVRGLRNRDIPVIGKGIEYLTRSIKARSVDRSEVNFSGGEAAMVYVHTNDDADIDLYVYDELNNLVCVDEAMGPSATCVWRPRWNGTFLVDVRSRNENAIEYVLAIKSAAVKARESAVAAAKEH